MLALALLIGCAAKDKRTAPPKSGMDLALEQHAAIAMLSSIYFCKEGHLPENAKELSNFLWPESYLALVRKLSESDESLSRLQKELLAAHSARPTGIGLLDSIFNGLGSAHLDQRIEIASQVNKHLRSRIELASLSVQAVSHVPLLSEIYTVRLESTTEVASALDWIWIDRVVFSRENSQSLILTSAGGHFDSETSLSTITTPISCETDQIVSDFEERR